MSLRLTAKELVRSPLIGANNEEEGCAPALCPKAMWNAVAPWLARGATRSPGGSRSGGGGGDGLEAPCLPRAESVRASLKEAMALKPELETARAQVADLVSTIYAIYIYRKKCICISSRIFNAWVLACYGTILFWPPCSAQWGSSCAFANRVRIRSWLCRHGYLYFVPRWIAVNFVGTLPHPAFGTQPHNWFVVRDGLCHVCLWSQTVELASRSKELTAATSKREQLEALLEKAEGSQIVSTDLQNQVHCSQYCRSRNHNVGEIENV